MLRESRAAMLVALSAAVLMWGVAVHRAGAQEPAGDPALVLHYTFDRDTGETAKDLSAYGNDGKIVKAKYLKEFDGRRGVLRFDGKESMLHCPNSDSLDFAFDTDMTFEMWVRLNSLAGDSRGMIFGDLNNFGLFLGYWNVLTLYYSRFNTELGTHESADAPVPRSTLSDKWAHVAVVAEYPRIRVYKNGELVRDIYMPVPGTRKRYRIAKRIGGWDNRCAPIDLDEFRLYRRALTAEEVAAHARGEEVPPAQAHELAVEPYWYEDALVLRLSCKGVDYANHTAEMGLLDGNHKPVVTPQKAALSEAYEGCGRYVATVRFPLAGLEGKSLEAMTRILGPNGTPVKTVYRKALLKKPEWVHTKEGYSDDVVPPWTPVETAQMPDGRLEVRVWGRRYVFGVTPFPQQIETRGARILASPISLKGQADGKPVAWKDSRPELTASSRTAASLRRVSQSGPLTLRVNTKIEYDGYAIFDCEIKARRDLSLENLVLAIPLRTEHAKLCQGIHVYPPDPKIPMKEHYADAVRGDLSFRFSPSVWLGDDERGLCWQTESDQYWHVAGEQKAIQILPRGKTTIFRANLVDVPTRLAAGDTLRYTFALLATPAKPLLRDAWDLRIVRCEPYGRSLSVPDATIRGKPAIQFYREKGIRHLFTTECDLWPYPLPVHERYSRLLHRLNDALHAAGIRHLNYQIHERFATGAPEFDLNGLHMSNRPLRPYSPGPHAPPGTWRPGPVGMDYGADSQATMMFCPQSKALQDACVHALARRLDIYGDDGVYLDGTGGVNICRNTLHGCGYRAEDGSIHATWPVFANREFMRRLYIAVKQRKPDGVMDVHQSYDPNPSSLTYADSLWTGEHWWHLRKTGAPGGYISGQLSLEMFRTEFTGYQLGVAAETLAYRLGPPMKVAAISLLHDIPVRPSTPGFDRPGKPVPSREGYFDLMSKLWKVRDQFGAKQAEKLFYWKNQEYVSVSPEKCYATLFKHPKNGVLAFVTNLRRDPATVTVRFNLEKLGLAGKELDAFNALTKEPVALTPEGRISIPLGSEEWAYVWLRPKAAGTQ